MTSHKVMLAQVMSVCKDADPISLSAHVPIVGQDSHSLESWQGQGGGDLRGWRGREGAINWCRVPRIPFYMHMLADHEKASLDIATNKCTNANKQH